MENKQLTQLIKTNLPIALREAINGVLNEDEAYVADELVELSETILLELAALGMAAYLNQPNQKSVYNDFLLQLFTTKSHAYNAGPLYRWVANMIKELDTQESKTLYPLFWEKKGKTVQLNSHVHHLALLRNEVMHGFFLLPPERNHKEASHVAEVIAQLNKANVFSLFKDDSFHFISKQDKLTAYSGRWGILYEEWPMMQNAHAFGELSLTIRHQLSDDFSKEQDAWLAKNLTKQKVNTHLIKFINDKTQGALAYWHRPNENVNDQIANLYAHLKKSDTHLPMFLAIDREGITFTSKFLLIKIISTLETETGVTKYSSDSFKAVKELRKNCSKQPVIIIKDIHQSLFQSEHLLHLVDYLYENSILLIAFGVHYTWMDQFFNDSNSTEIKTYLPKEKEWLPLLDNYLRYKGPNKEFKNELEQYTLLKKIITHLLEELSNKEIVARRFADEHKYPMEYVHEAFSFLHPFLKSSRMPFKEDVLDDLYGFPKEITESSRIYFSIGRRDAKLEYQHQTLAL
jgi:hypothetical protein